MKERPSRWMPATVRTVSRRGEARAMSYTIGELGRAFSLSRSTLLYYHSLGLLRPSARTDANYRLYSEADRARLGKIVLYRKLGLPLDAIADLLVSSPERSGHILERRLADIQKEVEDLRRQQGLILKLLDRQSGLPRAKVRTRQDWLALFASLGIDQADMIRFHVNFERSSPAEHQGFLQAIGIEAAEIQAIRDACREASPSTPGAG